VDLELRRRRHRSGCAPRQGDFDIRRAALVDLQGVAGATLDLARALRREDALVHARIFQVDMPTAGGVHGQRAGRDFADPDLPAALGSQSQAADGGVALELQACTLLTKNAPQMVTFGFL